jgi:predicted PolB exonuclease-like 3'-5' exonuclease
MAYIILDIETVPHPDAHQWAEPVKAAGNLKDPEKIEADLKAKREKQADEFGLDADCCRAVALGFHVVGRSEPTVFLMRDEFEERAHLQMFRDAYRAERDVRLVTFNGFRFDLPVLMRRAMYLDVDGFPNLSIDRYRSEHIDLWQRLSFNGAISAHSLAFYAKRLGFGTLDKVHGSDIARLAAEEKWQEIHDHCLSDIGLTHALANRLGLLKLAGVAA